MHYSNKRAYSIIMSLLLVGFLLVMITGIFRLILIEMKDNKGVSHSLQAYAGAESAQELALLKLKEYGYGYYNNIEHKLSESSSIFLNNITSIKDFRKNKDAFISYSFDSRVKSYSGSLDSLQTQVIPLFYVNELGTFDMKNGFEMFVENGSPNDIVWNIISQKTGISGKGEIGQYTTGIQKNANQSVDISKSVTEFLSENSDNYLVLFNSSSNSLDYNMKGFDEKEYFTKPYLEIISSGEIAKYRQNLKTNIENKEFLFSIFSN